MANDALRGTVLKALYETPNVGNVGAATDAVLAALGLDDFKAAVERGAKALGWDEEMDHEPHGEQLWDEAQAVLEAALTATEEGEAPDG